MIWTALIFFSISSLREFSRVFRAGEPGKPPRGGRLPPEVTGCVCVRERIAGETVMGCDGRLVDGENLLAVLLGHALPINIRGVR